MCTKKKKKRKTKTKKKQKKIKPNYLKISNYAHVLEICKNNVKQQFKYFFFLFS